MGEGESMSLDSFIFFPSFGRRSRRLAGRVFKKKKKKRTSLSSGRPLWLSVISRRLRPSLTQSDGQSVGRTDGQTSSHHPCLFVFPGGETDGHRLSRRPFSLPSLSSPPPLQPLPDLFCLFPILSSLGWRARGGAASFVRSCQTLCVRRNLRLGDRPAIDWRPGDLSPDIAKR